MLTDEQRQLVTDNHNLIYSFLKKNKLDADEYYDLAAIGLCKSVKRYNENVANFSTYAYTCMHNEISNEFRKNSYSKRIPKDMILSLDHEYKDNYDTNDSSNSVTLLRYMASKDNIEDRVLSNVYVQSVLDQLNEKDKEILSYIVSGLTYRQIAKIVGCSHQNIAKIKTKIANYLRK